MDKMKILINIFIIFLLYQTCATAQKVCLKAKYEKNVLNGTEYDVLVYEKELCVKETTDCFTVNYDYNLNANESFEYIVAGCRDTNESVLCPYANSTHCNIISCNENLCNEAAVDYLLATVPPTIDYPDINICRVPSCDSTEIFLGATSCVGILVNGYLLGGTNNCKNGWDKAVNCLAKLGTKCSDGRCLPNSPLKYILQQINEILSGVKDQSTLSDALKVYIGFDTKPIFEPIVCSNNITKVMDGLVNFQSQLAETNFASLFSMFGIQLSPCVQSLFKLQNLLMEIIPRLTVSAPSEIVKQLMIFLPNMIETIQPCGDGIILETVLYYFQEFNNFGDGLFQNVMKMLIDNISSYPISIEVTNSKLSECPVLDRNGKVDLNCQRFHHKSSECDLRRAWFCDYSSWRINILETILKNFDEKIFTEAGFMVPDCNDHYNIICRSSQKCCYTSYNGCKICFCSDQDYINEYYLEKLWKNDSKIWTNFVHQYYKIYPKGPQTPIEDPSTC